MGIDIRSFEHRDNCFEINFLKSSRILISLGSRLASTSSFGKRTFWLNHVEYEDSTRNLKFAPIFNISNSRNGRKETKILRIFRFLWVSKYCWTRLNKESEKQISFLILELSNIMTIVLFNFLKSSRILIDLDSRFASTSSFGKRRTFWLNHVEYENSTRNSRNGRKGTRIFWEYWEFFDFRECSKHCWTRLNKESEKEISFFRRFLLTIGSGEYNGYYSVD